jgi:CBS domain-containing protein
MTPDEARAILLPLAARANDALAEVGFPLCPGGIMARNPECCLSAREWRVRFQRWMTSATPENLLRASIFFDFRALRGDPAPVEELRRWLLDAAAENGLFRRHMAANALRNAPPLGMFRDFKLSGTGAEANTIDLKKAGVTPFVDAARILALGKRVAETNTSARLSAAAAAGAMDESDAAAWIDAYDYVRMLRMRLNEDQAAEGRALGNRIDPAALNELDRRILRESFREARRLQARLQLEFQL